MFRAPGPIRFGMLACLPTAAIADESTVISERRRFCWKLKMNDIIREIANLPCSGSNGQ
jgi:hypothetical protein